MKDLVIIGSGPAGLSAGVYAKRAMLDVIIIEERAFSGGQIVNTHQVDNYLGMKGVSGFDMGMKFREHADALGISFVNDKVTQIKNNGDFKEIVLENEENIKTKAVIVATGATHRLLGVKGEKELTGAGVSYCATCDGAFFKNKEVAVVGGGNVALGDVIYLSKICSKVHLIHRRQEFRGANFLADRVLNTENVEFHPYRQITKIAGNPGQLKLSLANVSDKENGKNEEMDVAGLFVAVGMRPVTDFMEDIVRLDENGYIVAGEDCVTSTPGIFAVGDVRTKKVRQVATAVGDGANAVNSVQEYLSSINK